MLRNCGSLSNNFSYVSAVLKKVILGKLVQEVASVDKMAPNEMNVPKFHCIDRAMEGYVHTQQTTMTTVDNKRRK